MKKALVTGGSGGIGAAICRQLALDGFHVIVHANRHPEQAEATVAAIRSNGGSAEALCFDVANSVQAAQVLETLAEAQPVQVIVNNAGCHADGPLAGMDAQQWSQVIDVSLNGFFNVTQPLLLPMICSRWGRIINISSIAAIKGNRGQVNYAAAKAGLHGATKSLAREIGSRGITVNAIAPGVIDSPMTRAFFDDTFIKREVPLGRAGTPEEVAYLVSFLASDRAAYISGQILSINGAMA